VMLVELDLVLSHIKGKQIYEIYLNFIHLYSSDFRSVFKYDLEY